MSSCKKSSSLNKKSCHRKKPNGSFNHTWSASTCKAQLLLQEQSPFNLATASNYIVSTLPIETRISFYEKKYQLIMESETQLASWIKAAKEQASPPPKPSTPIPTATRSRLPDFLFASLSTRPKRKSQIQFDLLALSPPTAKSSISTFLRRASDTLTTSYSKRSTPSTTPQNQYNHRFSLTSSLNRLSLSRNSCSSMILSEEPSSSLTATNNEIKSSITPKSKYKRFSTPLSSQPHILQPPLPLQQQRQLQQQQAQPKKVHKSSIDNATVKRRPQSSILPQASSSIFLERLRSRSPISDKSSKSCQQQPNVLSQSNTTHYNSNSSIGTMDEDTPPSSPSSIDSISTPPHTPNTNNNNGHHLLHYQKQQRHKRRSQELFFTNAAATTAKHKPSLTTMSHISEDRILEQQEDMLSLAAVTIHITNSECSPASTATAIEAPLHGGNYTAITATSLEKQQVKKKRASLSITPSSSTIRLLSQKSQFLRRQSMLA
ncbi:uncharacterized protein ATC70_011016 [Mucor velutinosus]|uniref:Uncharacterized protein n=1 Tax=Mucor velutinosus TaxID=708070 RepID=A0AAN7DHI4_9FUNG|nr:hypothetical protein ATC70_011016 [Mucor velutinosus]